MSRRGLAIAIVAGALAAVVGVQSAAAEEATLGATDTTEPPGETLSVDVFISDMPAPGLGAWTIDIVYDAAALRVLGCAPEANAEMACNVHYATDTVRLAGATARGLEGDGVLTRITFECVDREASSVIDVRPVHFFDATIGGPQPIDVTVSDGSATCAVQQAQPTAQPPAQPPVVPDAGDGEGSGNDALPVLLILGMLASAGLIAATGARAFIMR